MLKKLYHDYILKYYKAISIVFAIILFSAIGFYMISNSYTHNTSKVTKTSELIVKKEKEEVDVTKITYYVDIKGAVTTPSVYQVDENTRVIDVIKLAGGLTKEADTSVLNLSKKITDEMVIIVYTKDQINKFVNRDGQKEAIIKYIEKECKCPDPNINKACIDNREFSSISSKISINKATKEELMTLTGIGESKAQDILDYRGSNGGFKSLDEIKNVTGIGENIFDKIKDYITI